MYLLHATFFAFCNDGAKMSCHFSSRIKPRAEGMASLESLLAAGGAPPAEEDKVVYEHPLVQRWDFVV